DKLVVERPGILLWAIEGWKRLAADGRFPSPKSGQDFLAKMKDLSSPVAAFVHECCVVDPQRKTTTERLYRAYKAWCQKQGKKPRDSQVFGKDLHAAMPFVKTARTLPSKKATQKVNYYVGIDLLPGVLPDADGLMS